MPYIMVLIRHIQGLLLAAKKTTPSFGKTREDETMPDGVEEELPVSVQADREDLEPSVQDNREGLEPSVQDLVSEDAEEVPGQKTVGEIALEVLEGRWGDGQARRVALSDAGYNANEVQEAVHALLRDKDQPNE